MTYIVDTNIFVDAFDGLPLAQQFLIDNQSKCVIPTVVLLELFAPPNISDRERRTMWKTLSRFDRVYPHESDWRRAENAYRDWNPQLPKPDVIDIIIAQLANGIPESKVATRNVAHFENVCEVYKPY